MILLQLLRTLGALAIVLGLLAAALWYVRRYDIRLPGRVTTGSTRRLELVERLAIDGRRSAILLRRDGQEHLILLGPEGHAVIEAGIESPPRPAVAEDTAPPMADPFAALVERAVGRANAAVTAANIGERMAKLARAASEALGRARLRFRPAREGENPERQWDWVPAFAGMTVPPAAPDVDRSRPKSRRRAAPGMSGHTASTSDASDPAPEAHAVLQPARRKRQA